MAKTSVKGFQLYKPTKKMSGSVIQFNPEDYCRWVWLEMAPQSGENKFDFDSKIVMKLGDNDILQLLDILGLVRSSDFKRLLRSDPETYDEWMKQFIVKDGNLLSIFHFDKNKGSSSTINVKPNGSKYGGGFIFQVGKKMGEKNLYYQIGINPVEALGIIYCLEKTLFNKRDSPEDEDTFIRKDKRFIESAE